jgi:hypothetical protein
MMGVILALIAVEKLVPSRRAAVAGTTAVLTTLGVLVLTAPGALPGLTAPDDRPMAPMAP